MRAKVSFLSRPIKAEEQKPRTAVNRSALISHGSNSTVFVVEGNRVIEKRVTVGEELGDMIEILEGVKAGERVVVKPPNRLRSGSRIKTAEK
jgi:multidrug efflux pump subunit AcrA (membrane-fusion protein)